MIITYLRNIVKIVKWKIILITLGAIFLCLRLNTILGAANPSINQLIELNKCPICFGTNACNFIKEIDIVTDDFLTFFSYWFGVKNVFFGMYNKKKVVLKKLAHTKELNLFDKSLHDTAELRELMECFKNAQEKSNCNININHLIKNEISGNYNKENMRLRLCPTVVNLDTLFLTLYENNKFVNSNNLEVNFWTIVKINPEPILLQVLPSSHNWPVPTYLGACGRLIIEEYVGLPLKYYYDKSWHLRIKIASSLLNAAYLFTFRDKRFGYYLTDISADNIAIDVNHTAKFIDLENIIIVDKSMAQNKSGKWETLHMTSMDEVGCKNCFAFSPEDICSHYLSDHNYYAICQLLLSHHSIDLPGGFLHNLPHEVKQKYPEIEYLMNQCAHPQKLQNRIDSGYKLKETLDKVLKVENNELI
ncbi:divergent protein kinase domain 2A [Prorops nasuta]|uniref:divergent protein kinase domain 2A n=1 Tax=Prorops nasuta TaxID=863751 RepID=UPI0034CD463D